MPEQHHCEQKQGGSQWARQAVALRHRLRHSEKPLFPRVIQTRDPPYINGQMAQHHYGQVVGNSLGGALQCPGQMLSHRVGTPPLNVGKYGCCVRHCTQ